MELLFIALVLVAVLIAAIGIGVARQGQLGGGKAPPALPPPEYTAPPPAGRLPYFRKRSRGELFRKRVPTPPPQKKTLGQKGQGDGGKVKPKEHYLDFNLPCPVTGRVKRGCTCQICRDLRKKFGV